MKTVNLLSTVQVFKSVDKSIHEDYFNFFKMSNPKPTELNDLESLVEQMSATKVDIELFDNYFFGYIIPQISKEFDLLRIGSDLAVNIELKSENTGAKMLKQMVKNQYYLSFLKKDIFCFTYVSVEKQLYLLGDNQELMEVDFDFLADILSRQSRLEIKNIDNLFNPSNYLVSPFNSTDEFMKNKYFLTSHQEEIKNECLKALYKPGATFVSISGKAGTGKTLLAFDIVKEVINDSYRVLVVHCGILNSGHIKLRDEYGWEVIPIKAVVYSNLSKYFLIMIDEAQRIRPYQLRSIVNKISSIKGNCIFSLDPQQCLRIWESNNNISQLILEIPSIKSYQLTDKIRTNKEIATFIGALFDKGKSVTKLDRSNIELNYFEKYSDAKRFIRFLSEHGWKIINYTSSSQHRHTYDIYSFLDQENAHGVIGQEFEKVIAVIDSHFCYLGDQLTVQKYQHRPYYSPTRMLYQIMSRTRKKLNVVIINNEEILERCLTILN